MPKAAREASTKETFAQVKALTEQLIGIKAAIAKGNQGAIDKIVELGEVKSIIGFLNRLDTSEAFSDDYSRHVKLEAAIRKADVLIEVDTYQRRANAIQDELDDFNASHFVDIELTA